MFAYVSSARRLGFQGCVYDIADVKTVFLQYIMPVIVAEYTICFIEKY